MIKDDKSTDDGSIRSSTDSPSPGYKSHRRSSSSIESPKKKSPENAADLIKPEVYSKLYEHQRQGVEFFFKLYKMDAGGVLGDDMGYC